MLSERKKFLSTLLFVTFLIFCVWTMTIVLGCGWTQDNIPSASSSLSNQLTLSWDEVSNANFYNIYFSTEPGVQKHNSEKIPNAANPITIVDLQSNVTYYFVVTAVNDLGEGAISKEISYRVDDAEGFLKIENLFSPHSLTIFFGSNSTKLSSTEIEKLNRFAKYILGISRYHVRLDGYTDSAGDRVYNKLISQNRAAIVKSYLVSRGVKAEDIDITGHGAKKFIADNSTPEGRRKNRRVEINFQILD